MKTTKTVTQNTKKRNSQTKKESPSKRTKKESPSKQTKQESPSKQTKQESPSKQTKKEPSKQEEKLVPTTETKKKEEDFFGVPLVTLTQQGIPRKKVFSSFFEELFNKQVLKQRLMLSELDVILNFLNINGFGEQQTQYFASCGVFQDLPNSKQIMSYCLLAIHLAHYIKNKRFSKFRYLIVVPPSDLGCWRTFCLELFSEKVVREENNNITILNCFKITSQFDNNVTTFFVRDSYVEQSKSTFSKSFFEKSNRWIFSQDNKQVEPSILEFICPEYKSLPKKLFLFKPQSILIHFPLSIMEQRYVAFRSGGEAEHIFKHLFTSEVHNQDLLEISRLAVKSNLKPPGTCSCSGASLSKQDESQECALSKRIEEIKQTNPTFGTNEQRFSKNGNFSCYVNPTGCVFCNAEVFPTNLKSYKLCDVFEDFGSRIYHFLHFLFTTFTNNLTDSEINEMTLLQLFNECKDQMKGKSILVISTATCSV